MLNKQEAKERREFLQSLIEKGLTPKEAFEKYDAKFGTHYSNKFLKKPRPWVGWR